MTAQVPEILIHRQQKFSLFDQPLYPRLTRIPKARRPKFAPDSTACHRGYTGTWEVREGMLTLVALEGGLWQGDDVVDASLELVFPKARGGLPATWFTGELRCVEGLLHEYVHHGFGSQFERDRLLHFEKGRLMSEFIVLNPPPSVFYQINPDGSRTCKSGPVPHADEICDPLKGKPFDAVYEEVWSKRPEGEEFFGPIAWTNLNPSR
jgi:hypothetical protein